MPDNDLSSLPLADATIVRFAANGTTASLTIKDWRESQFVIVFQGVLALEVFSIEGEEIGRGTQDVTDPFLQRTAEMTEEDLTEYKCFCFHSAWDDKPRLKVVALRFVVE